MVRRENCRKKPLRIGHAAMRPFDRFFERDS